MERRPEVDGQATNWALVMSYDGDRFHGFQSQLHSRTIQDELSAAMKRLNFTAERVIGAGRTDSGVSAERQVVTVVGSTSLSPDQLRRAINAVLPKDIRVLWVRRAPDWFDARRSVASRVYRYKITDLDAPHPAHTLPTRIAGQVDTASWRDQLRSLIGVRDFADLAVKVSRLRQSTIRHMIAATCWREGREVVVEIEANSFLTRMVRLIVGGLMRFTDNNGERGTSSKKTRLSRAANRWPAPAQGLTFYGVTTPGILSRRISH